jgi:hypothetical protein
MFKSFSEDFLTKFCTQSLLLTKYGLTLSVLKYVVGAMLTSGLRLKKRTFKVLKVLSTFTLPY